MRIRTAIAVAAATALLPTALAFAPTVGAATEDGCRTDETRIAPVLDEDGEPTTDADGNVIEAPVEYCEVTVFAQCDNTLDSDGAAKVVDPTAAVVLAKDAPPGSFTAGNGCGTVDEPVLGQTTVAPGPTQYYLETTSSLKDVGNVDTFTFEVHFLGPNTGYAGQEVAIDMRMVLDNVSLFGSETILNVTGEPTESPLRRRITAVPTVSDTGASSSFLITVTGLADYAPDKLAYEGGKGADKRKIQITLDFPHTGACQAPPPNGSDRCVPFGPAFMVMGADEVPTKVVLNSTAEDLGTIVEPGDGSEA